MDDDNVVVLLIVIAIVVLVVGFGLGYSFGVDDSNKDTIQNICKITMKNTNEYLNCNMKSLDDVYQILEGKTNAK